MVCALTFSNRVAVAAQISAIEKNQNARTLHALIDEGTLHGYNVGNQVCVRSDTGENLVCSKILKANELFSLIAIDQQILDKIRVDLLVVPQDFVAVKPKVARICQQVLSSSSAQALPDLERFRFELFRKGGLESVCAQENAKDKKLTWELQGHALQALQPETSYHRVGFITRNGASVQKDYWGSRKSEARATGYGSSVQIERASGTYLQFSYRALGPAEEDLNDFYSSASTDFVRSRTTYASNALSAAYLFSKNTAWTRLYFGGGLDINTVKVEFKSFRSGSSNQVLGSATSNLSILGILGQARADVPFGDFAVNLGLLSVLPVAVIQSSYAEVVSDLSDSQSASKSLESHLNPNKGSLAVHVQIGASMRF